MIVSGAKKKTLKSARTGAGAISAPGILVAAAPATVAVDAHPLYSFDVFDTVLTRLVGRPRSLFFLIGRRLRERDLFALGPSQFYALRIECEERARTKAGATEITLPQIYGEIAHALSLSPAQAESMLRVELDIEKAHLIAAPHMIKRLAQLRADGHVIAFISDTYFPRETLWSWLLDFGVADPSDILFASSEVGATKFTGKIFEHIQRELRVKPADWIHEGDHPRGDGEKPRALGIRTVHADHCELTRYEEAFEASAAQTAGLSSLLAGASRATRLTIEADNDARATMRDVAAQIGGPVLCSFVMWVLDRARAQGLKRLLFCARDGQVLLRIARILAPRMGLDIEMTYFYASRQVVNLGSIDKLDDAALDWILGGVGIASIKDLLGRVDLAPRQVEALLEKHSIPMSGPLGWGRSGPLRAFFTESEVVARIEAAATKRREILADYFASCGLMSGELVGIVDIGWRGNVIKAISKIIGDENAARVVSLYFGLYGRPKTHMPAHLETFMFDKAHPRGAVGVGASVPSLTTFMEIFTFADHAPVATIERRQDGFAPVLVADHPVEGSDWSVPYFQDCVERFAKFLVLPDGGFEGADLRNACNAALEMLARAPSDAELLLLSSIQFTDDQLGAVSETFASAFELGDLRAAMRSGAFPAKGLNWWEQGAIRLTPALMMFLMRGARKLGRLRGRGASR